MMWLDLSERPLSLHFRLSSAGWYVIGISLGICCTIVLGIGWEAVKHAWELPEHVRDRMAWILPPFPLTWLVVFIFLVTGILGIQRYRAQRPPDRSFAIPQTWIIGHGLLGLAVGLLASDLYGAVIRPSLFSDFVTHGPGIVLVVFVGIIVGCLLGLVVRPGPTLSHHLMYGAATGLGGALCLLLAPEKIFAWLSQFHSGTSYVHHVGPMPAWLSLVGPLVGGLLGAVAAHYQNPRHLRIPSLTWMGFGSLLGWLVGLGLGQVLEAGLMIGTADGLMNIEIVMAGALFGAACVAMIRCFYRRESQARRVSTG
jgi:hypothetical protein